MWWMSPGGNYDQRKLVPLGDSTSRHAGKHGITWSVFFGAMLGHPMALHPSAGADSGLITGE